MPSEPYAARCTLSASAFRLPSPRQAARAPGPLGPARAVPRWASARVRGNPEFGRWGPPRSALQQEPRGRRPPLLGEAPGCPGFGGSYMVVGAEVGRKCWRSEPSSSLVPQDLECDLGMAGLRIRLGDRVGNGDGALWQRHGHALRERGHPQDPMLSFPSFPGS